MKNSTQQFLNSFATKTSILKKAQYLMSFACLFIALTLIGVNSVDAQTIKTVAGNYSMGAGFSGDGGDATLAQLSVPGGVAVDVSGNLYIADASNQVIRKVDAFGTITTFAGTSGVSGYSGDGGAAVSAKLNLPYGVGTDPSGNVYIVDMNNSVIRKVNTLGVISTVAGNGLSGFSGDGFDATNAQLNYPSGIAIDASGNMFISDQGNNRVRKVTSLGIISTYAGTGLAGYSGDNGPALAADLSAPWGVALDAGGNLYIADMGNHAVRMVDGSLNIYSYAGIGIGGYSGDLGAASAAKLSHPCGVATDGAGNLFISDADNYVVRKVDALHYITTYAGNGTMGYSGDGGPALLAQFNTPPQGGICTDGAGDVFVGDWHNWTVREITPTHACIDTATLAISSTTDGKGNCIYTATATVTTVNMVLGYTWSGGTTTTIDHTSSHHSVHTFMVGSGSSAVISVVINVANVNYTDPSEACCQTTLTQTVTCSGGHHHRDAPGPAKTGFNATNLKAGDITVYPNPASDMVTVMSTQEVISTITLVNVNGQKVGEYNYNNTGVANISMSKLPAGCYLVRINNSISKVVTKK